MKRTRTPFAITFSVWRAAFLREALDRLFEGRAAWLWLLIEPIIYIGVHAFGFTTFHIHQVGGMGINMFIIAGFTGFLLWRRTWTQVLHGIDSNRAFFAYRQVKPFDVAIVRATLELFLMVPVSIVIMSLAIMAGHGMTLNTQNPIWLPQDPLLVMAAVLALWLLGLGLGLVTSVAMRFVPEIDHIFKILYLPLYYMSGALLPLSVYVPEPYQYILVANPVVDGVELMRLGFFSGYVGLKGVSLAYIYAWALGLILLGLMLYKRFSRKLVMR
ncbi:ABC transporter permease [Paraburkholderia tuberum]|uniref:Transport permease protein n=1 Tax=Paraburkholderia tuberum TaxID=157910 RepID=A0A1H1IWC9_9BURK|nr:ABC transporter permease [Paraburkholderia tuberum]SDR41870.1 capsular polysaccharide transport system permease protein [Paraburkholderia tuberum]